MAVTFGQHKTKTSHKVGEFSVGGTGLFLGNKRQKFVKTFLETRDTILCSSLNLCCCHMGGLFMSRPCCQWSAGKLVRYCELFILHDALLFSLLEKHLSAMVEFSI